MMFFVFYFLLFLIVCTLTLLCIFFGLTQMTFYIKYHSIYSIKSSFFILKDQTGFFFWHFSDF